MTHGAAPQTHNAGQAPGYFLDENPGRLLLLGFRIFERALLRHMADQGFGDIRMSHLPIMRNIARGGSRTTEIAEMAKMTKQTAGTIAGELEAMRYVRRLPDPVDGRAKLLRFTPRGKDFMARFPAALGKAEADMVELIGRDDFGSLTTILRRLVRAGGDDEPAAFAP